MFTLGGVGYASLPLTGKFGFELVVMMGGSLLLFYTLIKQGGRDLSRMILIGVIFGILFRSLSSLLSRMIDPEEFTAAQANMFATFNTVHSELLGIGAVVLLISAAVIWRERHRLDVYLLGRNQAINLGINYTRNTLWLLLWIAALVATATAVVGPVSFFGLLVAALANHFSPSGQTFRPLAHDFLCRRHPVGRRTNHLRILPRHAGRIERGRRICRRIGIFIFGVEKEIN